MDEGLIDLPQAKWAAGTGRQAILKEDFRKIEAAILQTFSLQQPPNIVWVDATSIKVPATADDPAALMMIGFPSQLHYGMFVTGLLSDGRYRENTADATLDFDVAASLWGTEKASQWYIIYALAGDADTSFSLKAMPFMRVKSQTDQTISLGTLVTPATGIGYGLTTDELAGYKLYMLSGSSAGLVRAISANNNDNTTGGTITYTGDPLTVAAGDWIVVLPNTNFRWIGDVLNGAASNIIQFVKDGDGVQWMEDPGDVKRNGLVEDINLCSPLARRASIKMTRAVSSAQIGHPDPTDADLRFTGEIDFAATSQVRFCRYRCTADDAHAIDYYY